MEQEALFRWFFIAIFAATFSISGYFRRKARRSGEVISRVREGKLSLLLRLLFAAPIYLSFLAYMADPGWMAWSSVPLPTWLRWLGVAVGFGMLPVLYWVVSTLGPSSVVLGGHDHIRLVGYLGRQLVHHGHGLTHHHRHGLGRNTERRGSTHREVWC